MEVPVTRCLHLSFTHVGRLLRPSSRQQPSSSSIRRFVPRVDTTLALLDRDISLQYVLNFYDVGAVMVEPFKVRAHATMCDVAIEFTSWTDCDGNNGTDEAAVAAVSQKKEETRFELMGMVVTMAAKWVSSPLRNEARDTQPAKTASS